MKDRWNKKVFNWCWNDRSVGAETTVSGSEFQICEAATGKARHFSKCCKEERGRHIGSRCLCEISFFSLLSPRRKSGGFTRWLRPSVCLFVCSFVAGSACFCCRPWPAASLLHRPHNRRVSHMLPPREIYPGGGGLLVASTNLQQFTQ